MHGLLYFFFLINFIYLVIYFLAALCLPCCTWAFSSYSEWGLLFVAGCVGFSLRWLLLFWGHWLQVHGLQQLWHAVSVDVARGLQTAGSVVVAHRLSCSMACGIFPDQGSNPCSLHWQVDSQPLCHQGSPQCGVTLDVVLWKNISRKTL